MMRIPLYLAKEIPVHPPPTKPGRMLFHRTYWWCLVANGAASGVAFDGPTRDTVWVDQPKGYVGSLASEVARLLRWAVRGRQAEVPA